LDEVGVGDSVAVGGRGVGVIVGVAEEVGVVVAAGCVAVGEMEQDFSTENTSISSP
jgi:hypothetical protein